MPSHNKHSDNERGFFRQAAPAWISVFWGLSLDRKNLFRQFVAAWALLFFGVILFTTISLLLSDFIKSAEAIILVSFSITGLLTIVGHIRLKKSDYRLTLSSTIDQTDKRNDYLVIVDDNIDRAELLIRALDENDIFGKVIHFENGLSAVNYLIRQIELSGFNPCKALFLGLRLSQPDDLKFLQIIKENKYLSKSLPVILIGFSEEDIALVQKFELTNVVVLNSLENEEFGNLLENLRLNRNRGNPLPNSSP